MSACLDLPIRAFVGTLAIIAMLAWFSAPIWWDRVSALAHAAQRAFITRLLDRKFPPALTSDACAGCGQYLHNRDNVLNLRGRMIHARVGCLLAAHEPGTVDRYIGAARPYLVATGRVSRMP